MHRARTVLSKLAPITPNATEPQRLGSWLLRQAHTKAPKVVVSTPKRSYNAAAAEPFLNGSSSAYVEEMYNAWLADPKSVHAVSILNFLCEAVIIL